MTKRYYTITDVTEVTKRSRISIYRDIKSGKLPAIKVGRDWRVAEDDLRTYLNGGAVSGRPTFEELLCRVSAARPHLTSTERISLMCALTSDDDDMKDAARTL